MVNPTGMVIGEPVAGVSVIVPEYEPAASPALFTETVTVAGAVLMRGEADSQLPPLVVVADTEKLAAVGLEVTLIWREAGATPPSCAVKDRLVVSTCRPVVPALLTVNTTGTSTLSEPPATDTVILP